jgi:ubiquitin-conjugating enzyme E2 J1
MPTKPDGALGSLDYTKEERRALAIKSRLSAPKFGNAERQALIDEVFILFHPAVPIFNCFAT